VREVSAPVSVGSFESTFLNLIKWYGRMDGGNVVVPKVYFEMFDVDIPDEVAVEDGYITLGVRYKNIGWEIPDSDLQPVDSKTGTSDTFESGDDESEDGESETSDTGTDSGGTKVIETDHPTSELDAEEQSRRAKRIDQFQRWFGSGGEFPSANQLRDGVQSALNMFHDPTRLANENATTTGTAGFYFARGDDVPVEIVGPDSRKDRAITVPHKSEDVAEYEMLLYELMRYGLEDEFNEQANFDAIRNWTTDQVVDFRATMRADLESHLPEDMTLEEFLVLARFLLFNGAEGTTEFTRELLLREPDDYKLADTSPFKWEESPFDIPRSFRSGFGEMTKRRSDVAKLCQGFFLLKENFVDHDRLEPALQSVRENVDQYVQAVSTISVSEIPDAYRIGTTRRNASTRVSKLFEVVSEYANELQKLEQSFDSEELWDDVGAVRDLYSRRHTIEQLHDLYERLESSIQPLDANFSGRWEHTGELLSERADEVNLMAFGDVLNSFEEVNPDSGIEVLSLMYEYNESRATQDAWTIYETLAEMIETIEQHDDADVSQFRDRIREESAFTTFQTRRDAAVGRIGGI
jgi:hypothetical protein